MNIDEGKSPLTINATRATPTSQLALRGGSCQKSGQKGIKKSVKKGLLRPKQQKATPECPSRWLNEENSLKMGALGALPTIADLHYEGDY